MSLRKSIPVPVQILRFDPVLRIRDVYLGFGSEHFLIPDPDPIIFSSQILHEKWNANLLFFLLLLVSGVKS
jgi:hypothetical protein